MIFVFYIFIRFSTKRHIQLYWTYFTHVKKKYGFGGKLKMFNIFNGENLSMKSLTEDLTENNFTFYK